MEKNNEVCFNLTGSSVDWRNREFRETFEINEFINYYFRLHGVRLSVQAKSEKPDFFLKNLNTDEIIGVELTSVYLSNYSVPHLHMKDGIECIPYDEEKLILYGKRLVDAVKTKIKKAQSIYDRANPLYLSIYVNEYISIHMDEDYWQNLIRENTAVFSDIQPFKEIVFWPIANDMALSIGQGYKINII